jgi:hypothetical protein
MDLLSDNWYAVTIIPIGLLLIVSGVSYKLGLRIPGALGLGLLISLISIAVIHRYHFKDGILIHEPTNLYVSIYIIINILLLLGIVCYLMCKNPRNSCFKCVCCNCCNCKKKGPEYLYEGNYEPTEQDSIDVHGYTSPQIEHYQGDMLGYTTEETSAVIRYQQSNFVGEKKRPEGLPNDNVWETDGENIHIGVKELIDDINETSIVVEATQDDGLIYEQRRKSVYTNDSDSG